jgi:LAS superfamily LD-carboxypeptidase LdcB
MASTKPGPLGKRIVTFGLEPGPLAGTSLDTPGVLGRRDWAAPDFSFVRQPLVFEVVPRFGALSLGTFNLRLGAPRVPAPPVPAGLPEADLTPCATQEETDFKHRVYRAHVARASKRRAFFAGVAPGDLVVVEGSVSMRKDAGEAAKTLLAQMRADLAAQKAAGDAHALKVQSITVTSGYRDPRKDFHLWDTYYSQYYTQTIALRKAAAGGEHGDAARDLLVAYIGKYKAAPGFSNHTRGTAFDIVTNEGGRHYGADSAARAQAAYEKTWLRQWMLNNAGTFGFKKLATEVWHWDFQR